MDNNYILGRYDIMISYYDNKDNFRVLQSSDPKAPGNFNSSHTGYRTWNIIEFILSHYLVFSIFVFLAI